MKCGILCVGTELLWGKTVNTNASYLSQELNKLGYDVFYHYVVGDNPERLSEGLKYLIDKVDIVLCTGGLGPTEDDLTKETIAKTFDKKLVMNQKALSEIQGYFDFMKKEMTSNNLKQAYLPENCTPFYNKFGSAPGFAIKTKNKIVISMPGPPGEMKGMWENDVKGYLEKLNDEKFYYKNLNFFGIGESTLETVLLPLIHNQTDPTFATYVKLGQCTLRIASKSKDANEAKNKVENAVKEVKRLVGEYLYSEEGESLQEVVCKKLIRRNITISACESCTGGLFAANLVAFPGISDVFERSFITYSNKAKNEILGVKNQTLEKHTAVSREVAKEMAEGLHRITGSELCVSVTGLAGPGGGTKEIPVGTVYIGVNYNGKTNVIKKTFHQKGREYIREHACIYMFDLINKTI